MKRGIKFQGKKNYRYRAPSTRSYKVVSRGITGPAKHKTLMMLLLLLLLLRNASARSQVNTTNSGKQDVHFSALKGRKEERKRRAMHQSKTI